MELLIDTNILLDEFAEPSNLVWELCENGDAVGYVSTFSFANIVYFLRKSLSTDAIKDLYYFLTNIFMFVEMTDSDIRKAVNMAWKDFEDDIQEATAERMKADYIITRNKKDYSEGRIDAVSPEEFLEIVGFDVKD